MALLILISLLTVLVLGGIWLYQSQKNIKNNVELSSLQDARFVANYVYMYTENISTTVDVVSTDYETVKGVREKNISILERIAENLYMNVPQVRFIQIVDVDGNIIYTTKPADIKNLNVYDWFKDTENKNVSIVTGLYYSYVEDDYVFAIASPVKEKDDILGHMVVTVLPAMLQDSIQSQKIDPKSNLFLVDNNGRIISHDNKTYVETHADFSPYLPVQNVLRGEEGVIETSNTFDEQLRIVAYSPVPENFWGILISTPVYIAYEQLTKELELIFKVLLLFIAGILLFGYQFSKYLTDPIISLSDTMRKSPKTNYTVKTDISRDDEIGDLANTFNNMISEIKTREERLRVLASIVESSDDAIISEDMDGIVTSWNRGAEKIYGFRADEIIGNSIFMIIPPGLKDETAKILETIKNGGHIEHYETVRKRKDGKELFVSLTISPIMDSDGNIIGASAIARDITESKRAEESIRKARDELEIRVQERTSELKIANEELKEAKAQAELYLDLMCHDINNMNQIGMGFIELALNTLHLDDYGKELISKPLVALESSRDLINNVKKLRQVKDKSVRFHPIEVCQMMEEIVPRYSEIINRDITIDKKCPSVCYVNANDLLYDVFSNVLGNSIKHSKGGLIIRIVIDQITMEEKEFCMVSIEDNGPGIPDELKDKLFTLYPKGKPRVSGKGLGIYLIKTLVDDFGGKISIEDRVPGDHTKGVRFIIFIPSIKIE
ncbi:PAS domain S-box protein [Methanooceanicella nereidis]|nr:PAS domain S-box protein [Methanocella sp. CWC-04]